MPFDPCGMIFKAARHTYTTRFRPFKDDTHEMDIVWIPAAPGAKWFPYPSFVQDLNQDVMERELGIFFGRSVGEVVGAERPDNQELARPGTGKGNFCGTPEMFRNGANYDPDFIMPRRPDGLPVCCGPQALLPIFRYRPSAISPDPFKGERWRPTTQFNPFFYEIAGIGPSSPFVAGVLGQDSFTYNAAPAGDDDTYVLVRDSGHFGLAGDWHVNVFFFGITLYMTYQAFAWDGIGTFTFNRTSGFGPLTIDVSLVTLP